MEHPATRHAPNSPAPGLIQHYQELLQTRHYARRSHSSQVFTVRRFLRFHRARQRVPVVLSKAAVRALRELLDGEAALVVGLTMAEACGPWSLCYSWRLV